MDLQTSLWMMFHNSSSVELSEAASAQALVLFCWMLVLTSLAIWLRRRARAGNIDLFGSWRLYSVRPEPEGDKPCNWQVGSARMPSGQQKWNCSTCGRDGFSSTKGPPTGCNWTG